MTGRVMVVALAPSGQPPDSPTVGYASVRIGDTVTVHRVAVLRSKGGRINAGMPRGYENGTWQPFVELDTDTAQAVRAAVARAWLDR